MDDHTFDKLTRSLGSGLDRRSALSAALSGLAAAAGVGALSAEAKKGKGKAKKGKGKAEAKKGKSVKSQQVRTGGTPVSGNPTCEDIGSTKGVKFDNDPRGSICQDVDISGCSCKVCIKVSSDAHSVESWTSTCGVSKIIVKAGNGALVYDANNATSGGNLASPENKDISHVDFCGLTCLTTTTTPAGTTTTPAGTTTTARPCNHSCDGKTCGQTNECGEICGGCKDGGFCVLDPDGQDAQCKTPPVCCPNGQSGICCSGYHCNGVCCNANDPGAISIMVTTSVFNSITVNTPPNSTIVTITTPPTVTPGRRKRRRHHRRRHGGKH